MLISGRGSNLQAHIDALAEGRLDATIAVVISNRADAQGLERARAAGVDAVVIDHRAFASRALFEEALVRELRGRRVSVVCLAGFMRLLGATFLEALPHAILNIHPSLLPAFPGVDDAQRQAWEHGAKVAGATVHPVRPRPGRDRGLTPISVPRVDSGSDPNSAPRGAKRGLTPISTASTAS